LEWSVQLLNAGADVLETPSFGAGPFTAEHFGAGRFLRREWNRAAVAIARQIGNIGPILRGGDSE
jgi:methionine synthase I (cobalamin-dependent)